MTPRFTLLLTAVATGLLFTGCDNPEVTTYRVPKEQPKTTENPTMPPASTTGSTGAEDMRNAELPGMTRPDSPQWQAPSHWIATDPGNVRVGSWDIIEGDARVDAAVTAFPGDVGGDAANINRWRMQVGLPPAKDEAVHQLVASNALQIDGAQAYHIFIKGTEQSIAGVVIKRPNRTWFIKLMGDTALTESQQDVMLEFANTFKFPE